MIYGYIEDQDFLVTMEEEGGRLWVHLEFSRFSHTVLRRLKYKIDKQFKSMDYKEAYANVDYANLKIKRLMQHIGFSFIRNARTEEGTRSFWVLEATNA